MSKYWYKSFLDINENGTFTIQTLEYKFDKEMYDQGFRKTVKQSLAKVVEYAKVQIESLKEYKEKNGSIGTPKSYDVQIATFKRAIQSIVS